MSAPVPTVASDHPIPARAGIGLRAPHYRDVLEQRPAIGWFEVHSENYFGDGGAPLHYLDKIREHYPLSLHGVGLSLGSADELDYSHLQKLRTLIARAQPGLVSEHLCWCSIGDIYLNDLLPLPYTQEALRHVAARIGQVQDFLGREILIENVSSYLQYKHSTIPEWEFLAEVAARSGCGILLDINNIYVSAVNHDFDALRYLRHTPAAAVKEMHLAGFSVNRFEDGEILIDTHGARVAQPVWTLYREAVRRFGAVPTLIEWDTDIPPLAVLVEEMRSADAILDEERHACVA
jgi:uncharacterized protein (UPF0276 family)